MRAYAALYGDTLGPAGSPGATYINMERWNMRVMVAGLPGPPTTGGLTTSGSVTTLDNGLAAPLTPPRAFLGTFLPRNLRLEFGERFITASTAQCSQRRHSPPGSRQSQRPDSE